MSRSPLKSIFLDALDCDSDAARDALIRERCGEDQSLMASVKELLKAHRQSSELNPAAEIQPRLHQQIREAARYLDGNTSNKATTGPDHDRSGEQIGNYRLMELLAEGGFGQVYVGQQSGSVKRLVAVKLLKPGMDSREIVARFEAERQALAMMHHPNIAQVFDAGTTPAGQPFLVMELVRGTAITRFCKENDYSIRQKLELMIDVCLAVQHAHQKGIIHRDIKPSNVMVAMDDTRPLVKVIDFGIAKAMGGRISDHTIYTRFSQIIGTPMYMSPEQAEMKAQDVDTLTDVYALGVLLYELLTEATPFDKDKIQSASFDEMRRIIREDQPLKPSARMTAGLSNESTAPDRADSGSSRAYQQRLQHKHEAINQLRGDLDWVILKAMDKDRSRRYETPAELARDLNRYLAGEPVLARAPTTVYRLTRFAQRNKLAVIATSLVLLSMIAGTGVSIWQALRATKAQAESDMLRKEAVDSVARLKEANILLDSARANVDQQRYEEALAQYSEATELQPEHFLTWAGRGSLFTRMGFWNEASNDYSKAIHLGAPANHPAWWGVPQLFLFNQDQKAYESICVALREQLLESNDSVQTLFAVRGLCLSPINPSEARVLSSKMESINLDSLLPGRRRGPPGPPGFFELFGEDEDRRRREGRDGGKRGPDDGRRGNPNGQGREGQGRPGPPPFRDNRDGPGFGPPWMVRELFEYVKALASYRAENYQVALQLLKPNNEGSRHRDSEMAMMKLPLTAMVLHQLGKSEKAKEELAAATALYRKSISLPAEKSIRVPWFDSFDAWILLKEAHQLILGTDIELEIPNEAVRGESKLDSK